GLGLFIRALLGNDKKSKKWMLCIGGILLLIAFKPYIFLCIIPATIFYYLYNKLPKFKLLGSLIILTVLLSLPIIIFKSTSQKALTLLSRKQFDFINVARGGLHIQNDTNFIFFNAMQMDKLTYKGDSIKVNQPMDVLILQHGSMDEPIPLKIQPSKKYYYIYFRNPQSDGYIPITLINNSFAQLIYNIPEALVNVLLRPYFTDPGSWLKYLAAIELIFIYALLIYAYINRRNLQQEDKALIFAALIFIFLLALTIGWVTPVLGAIVRYRLPILIGLVLISLIVLNPNKKQKV